MAQLTLLEKLENSRSAWKNLALSKVVSKTNFTALNRFFIATNGDQECDHVGRMWIRELFGKYLKMFVKF